MSQIFKSIPPINILFNLLEKICKPHSKYYIIDKSAFKLGNYNNSIQEFINLLLPFYHKAKNFYLERKLDYKRFLTIVRQISNSNGIPFNYYNHFDKSTYDIVYKIFKTSSSLSLCSLNSQNSFGSMIDISSIEV
jgi:hypothetical protein